MDIRLLVGGLRPMATFESTVERTIDVLSAQRDEAIALDDTSTVDELDELISFWAELLRNLKDAR